MKIRALVTITGIVQGVAFRHYTAEQAALHQVTGWVRNRADESVEGCFEGEVEDVRALIEWCHRGPRAARVERVQVQEEPYTGEFTGFSVRH